jgi:hypothetical protein
MAFTGGESYQVVNAGPGTVGPFTLKGGTYAAIVTATFGGGNLQLQTFSLDGVTAVNVGATITTAGLTVYANLPPGRYQWVITTSTAVYASLTRVET